MPMAGMGAMPPAGPLPLPGSQGPAFAQPGVGPGPAFAQPGLGHGPSFPPPISSFPPTPAAPAYFGSAGGSALGHEPTMLPPEPAARPGQPTTACPRCGTQTPLGFAFCQQCGFQMQTTEPAGRAHHPSAPPPLGPSAPLAGKLDAPIDPHAGTLAQDDGPRGASATPAAGRPAAAAAWGTAVLVNRDGSDGQRFALAGEYLVVGRAGADIAFEDDRFLARQHARLERGGDGIVKVVPLDGLNGVFRKTDAPVELSDGMTVLVGREVLRYEKLDAEEAKLHPLVRHGVALFGSPPREPWGRLVQLVPSGGYRDVRHLAGEETVLGREDGDIVFRDDAFMSRRHAAITWDGKRALITDLGSSNGTFVRLAGSTALRHGDHVRMGDQLLRLELR
jgi:pSer/pThr/pTyr-binding forkhead associated (FHA) protein